MSGVGVPAEEGAACVFLYAERLFLFGSLTSNVQAVCTVHDSAKMKT